jgi:ABC-2 type transport system ATP-binding protein
MCDGLRINGIHKIYRTLPFGWKSTRDVHALRGVYLEVPDKELLCILGHNGAGKSTLFSILTGVSKATEGTAKICGFDIAT